MIKLELKHEIACDESTFWTTFFDPEYNRKLFLDVLEFPEFKIIDQQETDSQISREVHSRPRIPWHQALGIKLSGKSFRFIEQGFFDKADGLWRWNLKANVMADKLHNRGTVRIESLEPNRIRRITEIELEANVFLLGRSMEKSAARRMRDGWDRSAVFMNETWLPEAHPGA